MNGWMASANFWWYKRAHREKWDLFNHCILVKTHILTCVVGRTLYGNIGVCECFASMKNHHKRQRQCHPTEANGVTSPLHTLWPGSQIKPAPISPNRRASCHTNFRSCMLNYTLLQQQQSLVEKFKSKKLIEFSSLRRQRQHQMLWSRVCLCLCNVGLLLLPAAAAALCECMCCSPEHFNWIKSFIFAKLAFGKVSFDAKNLLAMKSHTDTHSGEAAVLLKQRRLLAFTMQSYVSLVLYL